MPILQACARHDLLELLATFVQPIPSTKDHSFEWSQLSVAFLSRLATLLTLFCEQSTAMACDSWAWLRAEQGKVLPQAPSGCCSSGPPLRARRAFALLSAATFCTAGERPASVKPGWISAVAASIYDCIVTRYYMEGACVPSIHHHQPHLAQMLNDQTSALTEDLRMETWRQ